MVRTGAASGVATRYLARQDAAVVGMIGAGKQAAGQLEAVCNVRAIREIRVYSRTAERASTFCATVAVDARGTARNECGDLLPLVEKGHLDWNTLPELGEIIAGRAPGRTSGDQISLYESHGMAVQDVYVGAALVALARERGIGIDLPIGD